MSRSRRAPTADELRLWAEVARTVAPLGGRAATEVPPAPVIPDSKKPAPAQSAATATATAPVVRRAGPAPLAGIDRRTVSRLARGGVAIDARIDLHGMTQQAAHGRLVRYLREAQARGHRIVLVITGKGRPLGDNGDGEVRGVLRRAVPMWLSAAEMRPFVVGFGEAAPPHGGSGALYVRIRRPKG